MHGKSRAAIYVTEQKTQVAMTESDAAFRRCELRPREVHENGTAAVATTRLRVVIEHHDDVVNVIGAPQVLCTCRIREAHEAIVVAIKGRIAPAVVGPYSGDR